MHHVRVCIALAGSLTAARAGPTSAATCERRVGWAGASPPLAARHPSCSLCEPTNSDVRPASAWVLGVGDQTLSCMLVSLLSGN
eukprot:278096-Pleurochrysis_carterae.AAC.2